MQVLGNREFEKKPSSPSERFPNNIEYVYGNIR